MPRPVLSGSPTSRSARMAPSSRCGMTRARAPTASKGNPGVPCYRMWARKSTDNGATWLADMAFTDVVSPLPGQPDPVIVSGICGRLRLRLRIASQHINPWADGRVAINGHPSRIPSSIRSQPRGGGNIVLQARVKTQGNQAHVQTEMEPG